MMFGKSGRFVPKGLIVLWLGSMAACGEADQGVLLAPPHGATRTIDFETDEGTWMSVDVSPDGRWIVFDLLGHIYRVGADGGEAECLTQESGPSLNYHPKFSPDGSRIVFVSDRSGQDNLWLMDPNGGNPRSVYPDAVTRYREPKWTPDGRAIIVTRCFQEGHALNPEIWRFPAIGGEGERLVSGKIAYLRGPSITPDGKRLFYFTSYGVRNNIGSMEEYHVQSVDLETGERSFLRDHPGKELDPETRPNADLNEASSEKFGRVVRIPELGDSELAPEVSPDGKSVAFAMHVPGSTQTYRGHEYGPSTALFVRNLESGEERKVMDPIAIDISRVTVSYAERVVPGYAWTPDGKAIVLSEGGKLRRVEVATGAVTEIPFRARVHRVLSEQTRNHGTLDDSFEIRFFEWPSSSPDGRSLAFVAAGAIWLVDLPSGQPHKLAAEVGRGFQYTPSWSPDGNWIAFTTWDERSGGHVWRVRPDGENPERLTGPAGQYLYPEWSPDGDDLIVSAGPSEGPRLDWIGAEGYEADRRPWSLLRIPVSAEGAAERLVEIIGEGRGHFDREGRVRYQQRDDGSVVVLTMEGSLSVELVSLSSAFVQNPLASPGGDWVAYEHERNIYVAPLGGAEDAGMTLPEIDPVDRSKTIAASELGGIHHRWRDDQTLEWVNGNRYETYDVGTGERTSVKIELKLPRKLARGTIALESATIIPISADRDSFPGTILVQGGRITCVGDCSSADADHVVDLSGRFVMPGLVDVHAHHTGQPGSMIPQRHPSAAVDLAYGVTTIMDPSGSSTSGFPISELIASGRILGPRTFCVGESIVGLLNEVKTIETIEDARRIVNRRVDWGAPSVKPYRVAHRAKRQLLILAARERGVTVTAEGGFLYQDVAYAIDGMTGWEHYMAPIPIFKDVSTFFGRAKMVYPPTAHVASHNRGSAHYFRPRHGLLDDEKYNRFIPRSAVERQVAMSDQRPKTEFSFPFIAEGLADVIRAGGFGAIGEHGEQPGLGSHWEIWSYAEALTPREALTVATLHGAYFLGLEEEIGSIANGKLADLLILNSNPLEQIRNTLDIAYVMKGGVLYDDDTLKQIWPKAGFESSE